MKGTESTDELLKNTNGEEEHIIFDNEKPLTATEKSFLLLAERGDCSSVKRYFYFHC